MALTSKQFELIWHAHNLGSFQCQDTLAVDPGSEDDSEWAALVELGFAYVQHLSIESRFPFNVYGITREGLKELEKMLDERPDWRREEFKLGK